MRRFNLRIAAVVTAVMMAVNCLHAQYYEIANQLTNMLQAPLSGSLNYKGYVDVSGLAAIGENKANFVGISTTQGFTYSSWFFMGVGMGVDVAMVSNIEGLNVDGPYPDFMKHSTSKKKAMIPVFSDFRFNIGEKTGTGFFLDMKVGATWLIGDSYLEVKNGCLSGQTQFYFKPTLGVRIPTEKTNGRTAVNLGVTYQLITSGNNYNAWYGNSISLNALGLTIAYEW